MFQKCPKCDGTGIVFRQLTMNTSDPCPVCKGAMIISELTGLPPKRVNAVSNGDNVGRAEILDAITQK